MFLVAENESEVLDKLQMEDIFSDIQKKKINKDKKKSVSF